MSVSLNFDTEQLSSMELYSLQLQKVVADFTEFDTVTKQYVDQKVAQAKQELTDGASEALDTFRELEDYLTASGVAGGLVEQIAALSASVATEATRAQGAEASLQASVDAEATRAIAKETALQSEVDTTQDALGVSATGHYQASQGSNYISSATTFKGADDLLDQALKAESERAVSAEGTLTSNLNIEIFNRQTGQSSLQSSLTSEITRATEAEEALQTAINSLDADNSSVVDNLNAEILRATNREGELQADIDNEEARATGAESGLSASIQAEADRASAAEGTLQSNIEANSALIVNKHGEALAEVANEQARAQGAETALDTKIQEETARAVAVENALGSALGEEETRAQGREAELQAEVDDNKGRLDGHDGDIQALGERPHDGANGGFDIQHEDGNPENKYIYFSRSWRLFGSSDGSRLVFEYNKGTPESPNFVSAVPFISHV